MKRSLSFILIILLFILLTGCGIIITEDNYSLDRIDGPISCEYRIGKDAMWQDKCVDSHVVFDKEKFLLLFKENAKYDPHKIIKKLWTCDLRINSQDEWEKISETEFNVRAVFGDEQRNVSIYRYNGKLYFFVLSNGAGAPPAEQGEYFMELPEEMAAYWGAIIEAVEKEGINALSDSMKRNHQLGL